MKGQPFIMFTLLLARYTPMANRNQQVTAVE